MIVAIPAPHRLTLVSGGEHNQIVWRDVALRALVPKAVQERRRTERPHRILKLPAMVVGETDKMNDAHEATEL